MEAKFDEDEVIEYLTVRFAAVSEYARLCTLLDYYNKVNRLARKAF